MSMEIEEWRAVAGYEGLYEVSDAGRIRRLTNKRGCRFATPLVLSPKLGLNGNVETNLWKRCSYRTVSIHRLVAAAFLSEQPEASWVVHLDGNGCNNAASNLAWRTPAEVARMRGYTFSNVRHPGHIFRAQCGDQLQLDGLEPEEWRPCPKYPDRYEVSSLGRVRCVARYTLDGMLITLDTPQLRKPLIGRNGYASITVGGGPGHTHRFTIHRQVAIAFIGPCPDGHQVNHKDGVKHNNRAQNLEWATPKQNQRHASRMGFKARGRNHWASKLTEGQVNEIRSAYPGTSLRRLALAYGVSQPSISAIVKRKNWAWLPNPPHGSWIPNCSQ